MKNKVIILLCLFLALSSITELNGQKPDKKIKVTGLVLDGSATPVADAIIMVDGEKTSTTTDAKGYYKIHVSHESTKIGVFTPNNGILEELINGRKNIDFTFTAIIPYQKTDPLDEMVDIGYEKVKKKDVLVPVGQIDGGNKSKYSGYTNIYELIRGQVPGVVVNGTSIMIRSSTSVSMDTEPLFVVDGAPVTTIDNIYPQMVKSISVLKGSAASIYGSRGSNGVILISLLKGNDK
jgi:TonB-dependent SusC/RagA subfamily outer membrane receptor